MDDVVSVWLRRANPAVFVILLLAASYGVATLMVVFAPASQPDAGPASVRALGLPGRLLVGSVIAPLLETTIFQWLPIRLLQGKFPWPLIIIFSAALFGLAHTYSASYVFMAFAVGLVLSYGYVVRLTPQGRPFLLVCLIHAARNAIASVLL